MSDEKKPHSFSEMKRLNVLNGRPMHEGHEDLLKSRKESKMSTEPKTPLAPEEDQDLTWQREDESDNLQKSERPDKEYMEERNLCVQCQGIKRVCDIPGCPQKAK